jgi:hypothetical protein
MTMPPLEMALVPALAWDPVMVCYWDVLMVVHLGWNTIQARDPRSPEMYWLTWQSLHVVNNQCVQTGWLAQGIIGHVSTHLLPGWFDPLRIGVAS